MVLNLRQQQKFFSSYSFYEGLRITAGIMIPVVISIWLGHLSWGILAAIGALAAGITDVTGPPHHRFNGMLAATGFLFGSVWVTLLLRDYPLTLAIWLLLSSFFFSYILVYGNRAGQIGSGVMLVVVIMTDQTRQIDYPWVTAGFVSLGAICYMLISLLLDRIRPYRLAQQMVGESLILTGSLFELFAQNFDAKEDKDKLQLQIAATQQEVNIAYEKVREVLFKTRSIIKESTHKGRVLLLTFIDTVDLLELLLSLSIPGHPSDTLKEDDLLESFNAILKEFGNSLTEIGMAFQQNKKLPAKKNFQLSIEELEKAFETLKNNSGALTKEDLPILIAIRTMLDAFQSMRKRIELLYRYSGFEADIKTESDLDFSKFVMPSAISVNLARANFTWNSNIFRYACRVAAAIFVVYLVSLLLPLGHEYWLLLTVLVILKPAYSITARRNRDRLLGTALGVGIGFLILRFIDSSSILLVLMMGAMIVAFSYMRSRYFISVVMVTVFVLIAFRLLQAGDLNSLIADRMLDTFIGSVTALLFMWFIPPLWEKETIASEAGKFLHAANAYLVIAVQNVYSGMVSMQTYKYLRKQAYVQFGNFSDSFQRMNQEPQWMQQNGVYWYQLVVAGNTLLSNTGALSASKRNDYAPGIISSLDAYAKVITHHLHSAINVLEQKELPRESEFLPDRDNALKKEADIALQERLKELHANDGGVKFKEKLRVLKQLESIMENLELISKKISQLVEQSKAKAPAE